MLGGLCRDLSPMNWQGESDRVGLTDHCPSGAKL